MNGQTVSVDAAADELRDIQGYQSIIISDYVWWILGTVALLIIGLIVYRYILSRKDEVELSIYEKTIIDLDALDTYSDSKIFYLDYSDIVRTYLLERFDLNLFDKTLNELRSLLDTLELFDMQSKNQLLNIFAKDDMAKFARTNVSAEKRLEHLDRTKEILVKLEEKLEVDTQDAKEKEMIDLSEAELKEPELKEPVL